MDVEWIHYLYFFEGQTGYMLKKAMIYLGLGPDEHYDNYGAQTLNPNDVSAPTTDLNQMSAAAGGTVTNSSMLGRTVQPITVAPDNSDAHKLDSGGNPRGRGSRVSSSRSFGASGQTLGKPQIVSPDNFQDAEEIGNLFKSGQAVIVNLQAVDRDLRRRLVDFSSGLCYGRNGKMDRVADQVYLLTPSEIDFSPQKTR
ncbi:MAG: cell division protein SepF [Acidimicrobiaceae bacterium]|nr:cell division protein SepF [Acidimicrobiaceae bacterium]